MVVARCPHCQQSIAGALPTVAGRWTCPSCRREVGTVVEQREAGTIVEKRDATKPGPAAPKPEATLAEGSPTPFQAERPRGAGATMAERHTVAERVAPNGGGAPAPGDTLRGSGVGTGGERRAGPGGADPLIGQVLGGCRITEVLGRGAMGTVYKATQLSLDRTVALKVIREELCTDDDLLQRFQREAKTIGRFSTPHVVQIHDVGREQGVHFLVMEYVSGGSLLAHVNELPGRRLPPADAIRWMIESAEGLLEAERLQIVHRDVKPENILLDHAARVKVADFGISRSITMSVELTATQAVIGTPLYMSPEQCRAEKVDHRSDMYSLGATFCHLLAGKRPLHEDSVQELLRKKTTLDFLSPRKLAEDGSIPESLSRVIERMTALDREDRYASFKEVIEDLRRVERGEIIEPFQSAAARARRRRRLVKAAVALVVVGVLGLGGWRGFAAWKQLAEEKSRAPDPGGGPFVPVTFGAAQLESETAELRSRIGDRLVTRESVDASRDHARRATNGVGSKEAVALAALCTDADTLLAWQSDPEVRAAPSLALPFADLDRHWKRLRELRGKVVTAKSGAELHAAVDDDLKSREADDSMSALAELARRLDDVEQRIGGGLGSADVRRAARKDLDEIDTGRRTLAAVFPSAAEGAEKAAPAARVEAARAKLNAADLQETSPGAALTLEQATRKLRELETEFTSDGASKTLQGDAESLRAQVQEGQPLRDEVGAFVNLVGTALELRARLDTIKTVQKPAVEVPFRALATFGDECREEQRRARAAAVDPKYADAYAGSVTKELDRFFQAYEPEVRAAFGSLVGQWRTARDGVAASGGSTAFLALDAQLQESRTQLAKFFGKEPALVAELLPAAESDAAAVVVGKLRERDAGVAAAAKDVAVAAASLDAVTSSAAWRAASKGVGTQLAAAHASSAKLTDAGASDAASSAKLAELDARAKRWSEHVAKLDAALALLAGENRDLAAAGQQLDALGDPDLKDETASHAKAGVAALRQGFRALFVDLAIPHARDSFRAAATELAAVAPDLKYAADCAARLDALDAVVASMAPVRGGGVALASAYKPERPGEPLAVAPFWIDPAAVSIGEFQAFLAGLKGQRDAVQRILPALPWLAGAGLDAALDALAKAPPEWNAAPNAAAHARWPVENASYAQAIVFLALRERDLPTVEEWWLAAKGPKTSTQDPRRFPWDPSPTARFDLKVGGAHLCAGLDAPMAVDDGGQAVGLKPPVHHLAGNAEQWTKSRRGMAYVLGGRFDDTDEKRFSGEQPRQVGDVTRDPSGCRPGLRGVVRPRDFFALAKLSPGEP